jgi:hypothetical protein
MRLNRLAEKKMRKNKNNKWKTDEKGVLKKIRRAGET